jgi:hypothetical protein
VQAIQQCIGEIKILETGVRKVCITHR